MLRSAYGVLNTADKTASRHHPIQTETGSRRVSGIEPYRAFSSASSFGFSRFGIKLINYLPDDSRASRPLNEVCRDISPAHELDRGETCNRHSW